MQNIFLEPSKQVTLFIVPFKMLIDFFSSLLSEISANLLEYLQQRYSLEKTKSFSISEIKIAT